MIDIQNSQSKIEFTQMMDKVIRRAVKEALEHENIEPMAVSILITDNDMMRSLNNQYRKKDAPTDVLSFPLYDEYGNLDDELGDIVISLEMAQRQAMEYGHSTEHEIAFLAVHSVLHLLGYDHEEDETEMFQKQKEIMQRLRGFADDY
jgi:probable rRNA maturation factor